MIIRLSFFISGCILGCKQYKHLIINIICGAVGTCSLSGEYYTKIIYVEVQRSEYRSFGDKDPICKHNECNCFNTKKDLLYSFLDDSDYGKEETDINAELPL